MDNDASLSLLSPNLIESASQVQWEQPDSSGISLHLVWENSETIQQAWINFKIKYLGLWVTLPHPTKKEQF